MYTLLVNFYLPSSRWTHGLHFLSHLVIYICYERFMTVWVMWPIPKMMRVKCVSCSPEFQIHWIKQSIDPQCNILSLQIHMHNKSKRREKSYSCFLLTNSCMRKSNKRKGKKTPINQWAIQKDIWVFYDLIDVQYLANALKCIYMFPLAYSVSTLVFGFVNCFELNNPNA